MITADADYYADYAIIFAMPLSYFAAAADATPC